MNGVQYAQFLHDVSNLIGGADPNVVREIVELSNEKRYMVHGVRNSPKFSEVKSVGVKPLTPESGPASFWSTGTNIFGKMEQNRLETLDSAFFRYAHCGPINNNYRLMGIAIASYGGLESRGIRAKNGFEEDSCMIINDTVPRDAIHVIDVGVEIKRIESDPREYAKAAEKLLLLEMHHALENGYRPGGFTTSRACFS